MAYTIIRSDGSTLTTIQDGTINTTSTSLGLPGRSYSGYGQALNTNFTRLVENFASSSPPAHPLKGQLWFNTVTGALNVCPADGTTSAASWLTLTTTSTSGTATLANVNVTGNLTANNLSATNNITGDTLQVRMGTVTANLSATRLTVSGGATVSSLTTQIITSGGPNTTGTFTGEWAHYGNTSGNAISVATGNIAFAQNSVNGIKCDKYMYANGAIFNPSGTYTNASVNDYLTGANGVPQFRGNIKPTEVNTSRLSGGGTIQGIWSLESGSRLQATYADLAERYEADTVYPVGTVVEIGGEKEITAVKEELSEQVFGVVSDSYAYLMNEAAGSDATHPAIALVGRVKVKVTGKVVKGDRLVSAGNGVARSGTKEELTAFNVIGRALAHKADDGLGTVEAIVIVK